MKSSDPMRAVVALHREPQERQELFRRVERLAGQRMRAGCRFDVDPDQVAAAVLASSTWAVEDLDRPRRST